MYMDCEMMLGSSPDTYMARLVNRRTPIFLDLFALL